MLTDYDPILQQIDAEFVRRRAAVRKLLIGAQANKALAEFDAAMQAIDNGTMGARATWGALSRPQREVVRYLAKHGGALRKVGTLYKATDLPSALGRIGRRTVYALAARGLLDWDGKARDPGFEVRLSDRGRFVAKHGPA